MKRIVFNILVLPLLYGISVLPFPLLYLKSDVMFVLVYYVFRYRRRVTHTNLTRSFPEKSAEEIRSIERGFYRHFCDLLFETIKLATISAATLRKRCTFDEAGAKLIRELNDRGQSNIAVLGHCGNWEWASSAHLAHFNTHVTAVYHPLSDANMDRFMLRLRTRLGAHFIPMKSVLRTLLDLNRNNVPTTLGLIADQAAPPETSFWVKFLSQDTAVFNGPDKLAKKFGYPVVYYNVTKKRRGYYHVRSMVVTMDPAGEPEGQITRRHTALLEENIREQPAYWLWTHRRWKHTKPAGIENI